MAYKYTKFQRQWLQALEAGRYNQTQGWLGMRLGNKKVGYCCLGVAYKVAGVRPKLATDAGQENVLSFDGESGTLCVKMRDRLKLHGYNGKFLVEPRIEGKHYASLADMNDKGLTHKQIAAYIRANPENVFQS